MTVSDSKKMAIKEILYVLHLADRIGLSPTKQKRCLLLCDLYNEGELNICRSVYNQISQISLSSLERWQRQYGSKYRKGFFEKYPHIKCGTDYLLKNYEISVRDLHHAIKKDVESFNYWNVTSIPVPALSTVYQYQSDWNNLAKIIPPEIFKKEIKINIS